MTRVMPKHVFKSWIVCLHFILILPMSLSYRSIIHKQNFKWHDERRLIVTKILLVSFRKRFIKDKIYCPLAKNTLAWLSVLFLKRRASNFTLENCFPQISSHQREYALLIKRQQGKLPSGTTHHQDNEVFHNRPEIISACFKRRTSFTRVESNAN